MKFPINPSHGQLEKDPEVFKVLIDIDGSFKPGIIPAINKDSVMALMSIFRFATKPKVRGYVVSYQKNDEVIVSVQSSGYIDAMTNGTSLKGEPPECKKPKTKLPFWELMKVKPEKRMADAGAKQFTLEIIIDGAVEKFPVSALNKESMIALLVEATCEKLPRISGWNLFDEAGTILASVPAVAFVGELVEKTGLGTKPADVKSAGWSVVPAVAPTTQDFSKMIEKAKKEGRLPQ